MKTKPVAILRPVLMEVASPRRGRPSYRWVNGFEVIQPNGLPIAPYMRIREARTFCRDQGWAVQEKKV